MGELYGLLNLLAPNKYPGKEDFFERFGGGPGQISTAQQIHALRVSPEHQLICMIHLVFRVCEAA